MDAVAEVLRVVAGARRPLDHLELTVDLTPREATEQVRRAMPGIVGQALEQLVREKKVVPVAQKLVDGDTIIGYLPV